MLYGKRAKAYVLPYTLAVGYQPNNLVSAEFPGLGSLHCCYLNTQDSSQMSLIKVSHVKHKSVVVFCFVLFFPKTKVLLIKEVG